MISGKSSVVTVLLCLEIFHRISAAKVKQVHLGERTLVYILLCSSVDELRSSIC